MSSSSRQTRTSRMAIGFVFGSCFDAAVLPWWSGIPIDPSVRLVHGLLVVPVLVGGTIMTLLAIAWPQGKHDVQVPTDKGGFWFLLGFVVGLFQMAACLWWWLREPLQVE